MQLFSAVILENFGELSRGNRAAVPLDILDEFVTTWGFLDPKATGKISLEDLPLLLINVGTPLGVRNKLTPSQNLRDGDDIELVRLRRHTACTSSVLQVIKDLSIPIRRGKYITYRDTFVACAKRVLINAEDNVKEEEEQPLDSTTVAGASTADKLEKVLDMKGRPYTAADEYAARSVQNAYRDYREIRVQVRKGVHLTLDIPLEGDSRQIIDY
mmetsp:Transcript_56414/g.117948  ORF Transcript_56414/g.117948 Transcript_56414/m.117948 type:complete len:214 (+) Transcript_56414:5441-6082(+)